MAMIPTSDVVPTQANVTQNSQAFGAVGQGLQIGASLYQGYSAIEAAGEMEQSAELMGFAERRQIHERYAQAFSDYGDQLRREGGTRMVAAATSGVAMEGSVMEVFTEAKAIADRTRDRMVNSMRSEIQASIAKEERIKDAAKDKKKYGVASAAIGVGAALI